MKNDLPYEISMGQKNRFIFMESKSCQLRVCHRDGFEPRLEPANPQARTLNCQPAKARSPHFSPRA